jgi:rhodanese-related sulfurtransferase
MAPIPLAGPANRQGRLVADNIFGKRHAYKGTLGTSIVRVFDLVCATTGANERTLKRLNRSYKALYFYPNSHASYYPGAKTLAIKVLVEPASRMLLGVQIVGQEGVDKRIYLFATAIITGITIDDIAELELAYAPPFGSAKDPVNIVGMAAQNVLDGLVETISPLELNEINLLRTDSEYFVLDVRDEDEFTGGAIPTAHNIPLPQLRARLQEIPKTQKIIVYCASAQRSYYAARVLMHHGYSVKNLSGAYRAWKQVQDSIPTKE